LRIRSCIKSIELGVTKGGKRKAATPMKEAKTKKGKKTKDPIADSITHLASDGLTQDVVARLGIEKRYYF